MTKTNGSSNKVTDSWPGVTIDITDGGGQDYFEADAANSTVEFFPRFLRHYQGEFCGAPFELDDWQRELIIRPIFGWKRTVDHYRRFRTVYVEVPKKNGKSHLCAGIALYLLFC